VIWVYTIEMDLARKKKSRRNPLGPDLPLGSLGGIVRVDSGRKGAVPTALKNLSGGGAWKNEKEKRSLLVFWGVSREGGRKGGKKYS